jgi:hypothetical protein
MEAEEAVDRMEDLVLTGADTDREKAAKTADELFGLFVKEVMHECERIFSSEEGNGKYLDMTEHFIAFQNIKLLSKVPDGLKLPKDYLSWLQHFDELLPQVPLYVKEQSSEYSAYLIGLTKYLTSFFKKTHPLYDFKAEVEVPFAEMFEEEWSNGSLFGWESIL